MATYSNADKVTVEPWGENFVDNQQAQQTQQEQCREDGASCGQA